MKFSKFTNCLENGVKFSYDCNISTELKLRPRDHRDPEDYVIIEVNGQMFGGLLLNAPNEDNKRNTILVNEPHAFLREICKDLALGRIITRYNQWAQKYHEEWKIGKTGTLKRIERLLDGKDSRIPNEFDLRTVGYYFGAVPVLTVGKVRDKENVYFVSVLPSLSETPATDPIAYKTELLLSFQRHLPQLFDGYFEQIGFCLTAIFFGGDEEHTIKYAHRIRSIAIRSIRSKIEEIEKDHKDGKLVMIANSIREAFSKNIQIAKAVDAFAHLVTNYIYSFFCIKSDVAKYEKRLLEIVYDQEVLGAEHPISFLRECVKHISEPESSDRFLNRIANIKETTPWLAPFGEAAVFIGEIKRSVKKGFAAPTIFVGYHFDIEENDQAFNQLELAINENWKHLQLLKGKDLNRNIRWSLFGRIWIANAYLFLIPPTLITRENIKKRFDPRQDWLLLEFVYTVSLRKYCLTMKPKKFSREVFEEFKAHLDSYAPVQELTQLKKDHWESCLAETKMHWHEVLHDLERLPSMDALEMDSLASFEGAILKPLHQNLIELFFRAAYWHLEPDALLVLQILLRKFPAGTGVIPRTNLRKEFKSLCSKYLFHEAIARLKEFSFELFEKTEPLVTEDKFRVVTLRLFDIVESLRTNYSCGPLVIDHIVNQMLLTRVDSR